MKEEIKKGKEELYRELQKMHIEFTEYKHKPITTMEEGESLNIPGIKCKCLFLEIYKTNKESTGEFCLVLLPAAKRPDLSKLGKLLKLEGICEYGKLQFPKDKSSLQTVLGVDPGTVTPFGLLNKPRDKVVHVIYDGELMLLTNEKLVCFHPLVNDTTIAVSMSGVIGFIRAYGDTRTVINDIPQRIDKKPDPEIEKKHSK